MKRVIVVLVFVLSVSVMAQSPTGKGSVSLGGSISYTSQAYDNSSNTHSSLEINPKVGYFFFDNIYTALSLTYMHWNSGGVSNSSSDAYGFGPKLRYYFDTEKIKPFLGIGYNYMTQSMTSDDGNYITNEFIISGGVSIFILPSLALEGSLNYSFMSNKLSTSRLDPVKSKVFNIDIGFNYFIY